MRTFFGIMVAGKTRLLNKYWYLRLNDMTCVKCGTRLQASLKVAIGLVCPSCYIKLFRKE
jgi:hypothetical protein